MSRTPVTDPNHVPFTYVTEAVSYTVRDERIVEMSFAAEQVTDPDADAPPARVVQARLAMPVAAAAAHADVLDRLAAQVLGEPEAPAIDPAAVSHTVIVAGLDFVVRELLDHSVAAEARGPLLDWLRGRLERELKRANIEGAAAAEEGPAVGHALGVLDQMFERWQGAGASEAP